MTKRTPGKITEIRALATTLTVTEIARVVGVSWPTLIAWASEELIPLMSRSQASKKAWANPEVRARMSQARKKALADPEVRARMSQASKKAWADPEVRARIKAIRCGAKGVLIPKWIPIDLHDEFLEVAAIEGEELAASHIRRLKREMAT